MGAISAGLSVEGHFFPIISCDYGAYQATDARGRVLTRVRFSPVELVIDVPATDFLLLWAANPTRRYPIAISWHDVNAGVAIETLVMTGARCSGYHEFFEAGDKTTGSYRCHLTLTDPTGWQLTAGGPAADAQARVMPPGFVPRLIAPPAAPPPLELPPAGPGPLGLLGRLLVMLPELALATLVAVLIPANDADSPGYQSEKDLFKRLHNIPLTDKDRAELADLEQRHANGTLTPNEEGHLLALLARVKGLHLQKLTELRTLPSRLPNPKAVPRGLRTRISPRDELVKQQALMRENETADIMAQAGYDVEQNPVSPNPPKKPDYLIEGRIFDNYAPIGSSPRNIWSHTEAKVLKEQTRRVVLNLRDSEVNTTALIKQFEDHPIPKLEEVIIISRSGKIIPILP